MTFQNSSFKIPRIESHLRSQSEALVARGRPEPHFLSPAFTRVAIPGCLTQRSCLIGLKADIVSLCSKHGVGKRQLTGLTQDLCERSDHTVIMIMRESGAVLFRSGRRPRRIMPCGDVLRHYGGPVAVKKRLLEGFLAYEITDADLENFVGSALLGTPHVKR